MITAPRRDLQTIMESRILNGIHLALAVISAEQTPTTFTTTANMFIETMVVIPMKSHTNHIEINFNWMAFVCRSYIIFNKPATATMMMMTEMRQHQAKRHDATVQGSQSE